MFILIQLLTFLFFLFLFIYSPRALMPLRNADLPFNRFLLGRSICTHWSFKCIVFSYNGRHKSLRYARFLTSNWLQHFRRTRKRNLIKSLQSFVTWLQCIAIFMKYRHLVLFLIRMKNENWPNGKPALWRSSARCIAGVRQAKKILWWLPAFHVNIVANHQMIKSPYINGKVAAVLWSTRLTLCAYAWVGSRSN